jgi:hypothetical protein
VLVARPFAQPPHLRPRCLSFCSLECSSSMPLSHANACPLPTRIEDPQSAKHFSPANMDVRQMPGPQAVLGGHHEAVRKLFGTGHKQPPSPPLHSRPAPASQEVVAQTNPPKFRNIQSTVEAARPWKIAESHPSLIQEHPSPEHTSLRQISLSLMFLSIRGLRYSRVDSVTPVLSLSLSHYHGTSASRVTAQP